MTRKRVEVAAGVLLREDGCYLIGQRAPDTVYAGYWEFPGGKVEPGETPEAALVRELDEELAIAVPPAALVPLTFASEPLDGRQLILLLYVAREWQGEPRARHATALRWCAPDALRALAMPPADAPFIDALVRLG